MSSYKNTKIDGDLSVGRNANVGVNALVQGNAHVKGHLKVDGHAEFRHLKHVCKGLFDSFDSLTNAYPSPMKGWYAYVGTANDLPTYMYIVNEFGKWVQTEKQGPQEYVALEDIEGRINKNMEDIASINATIGSEENPEEERTIIQRINDAEDDIDNLKSEKAEKSEVDAIDNRLQTAEQKIGTIEQNKAEKEEVNALAERTTANEAGIQELGRVTESHGYDIESLQERTTAMQGLFYGTINLAVITRIGGYIDSLGHLLKAGNINSSFIPLDPGATYYIHQQDPANYIGVFIKDATHRYRTFEGVQGVEQWQFTVPTDGQAYWLQTIINTARPAKSGLWVTKDKQVDTYAPPLSLIELEQMKEEIEYLKTHGGGSGGGEIPADLAQRLFKAEQGIAALNTRVEAAEEELKQYGQTAIELDSETGQLKIVSSAEEPSISDKSRINPETGQLELVYNI